MLKLVEHFEPFIIIHPSTTIEEILTQLRDSQKDFAVVGDFQHPLALVSEDQLTQLNFYPKKSLVECFNELSPLLVVDGEVEILNPDCLTEISYRLEETNAPGLVIYQNNGVCGVVSWESIAMVLDEDNLLVVNNRIYGDPQVSVRTYICRQCAPPTYAFPRQGDTPTCPKDWLHGPMEQESA